MLAAGVRCQLWFVAAGTSVGPSILLAERWGLKMLDPLLGFDHAKISRPSVP